MILLFLRIIFTLGTFSRPLPSVLPHKHERLRVRVLLFCSVYHIYAPMASVCPGGRARIRRSLGIPVHLSRKTPFAGKFTAKRRVWRARAAVPFPGSRFLSPFPLCAFFSRIRLTFPLTPPHRFPPAAPAVQPGGCAPLDKRGKVCYTVQYTGMYRLRRRAGTGKSKRRGRPPQKRTLNLNAKSEKTVSAPALAFAA